MAKSWIVDGKAIARKVKNHQIKDCGANRKCPRCQFRIDNSDVSIEWPGLPIGVKFDPSDVELIEHLAAKCGIGKAEPHQFINEFIPTLDTEEGICYKHPENLPGARKDGSSFHFFYRTTNAYSTGQRKRRKIYNDSGSREDVRWHKTGKTKAIMQNGEQIGYKKIMVLYGTVAGGLKPYKLNWVMHQFHLGMDEDEKEGQYVVAKIFYQQDKTEKNDNRVSIETSDAKINRTSPMTPKTDAPDPPRPGMSKYDDVFDYVLDSPLQESDCSEQKCVPSSSTAEVKDKMELPTREDGPEVVNLDAFDDTLFCKENLNSCAPLGDSVLNHDGPWDNRGVQVNDVPVNSGITDLENLVLDTPPDFNLAELQFSSQDSLFGLTGWI